MKSKPEADVTRARVASSQARALHDEVLSAIIKPAYFLQESLLDDTYIIRTDDPKGRRRATKKIEFAKPALPGPVLLTDDAHIHDLLTLKLCVIYALDSQRGWSTSAQSIPQHFTNLVTLVRWRNAQGISRFSDLTPAFFESFLDAVAEQGTRNLIPLEGRIQEYIADLQRHGEKLPKLNGRLHSNKIARRLGVSSMAQVPARLWKEILEELRRQDERTFNKTKSRPRKESDEYSINHVSQVLKTWQQIYEIRDLLRHDPLSFAPWDARSSALSVAKSVATRVVSRTPLPPAYQTCFLLNAALDFVQNAAPMLLQMDEDLEGLLVNTNGDLDRRERIFGDYISKLRDSFTEDECPAWLQGISEYKYRQTERYRRKTEFDFLDILFRCLPGAAALVLAGFSARRHIELISLRHDCLWRDEYDRLFLTSWSAKNLRQLDSIPAPESIKAVVGILDQLSQRARRIDGSPWLFNFRDHGDQAVGYHFQAYIKSFVDIARIPPLPDGSDWSPQPHQFRVFFPTMYYHRFEFPSLTALSRYLRHADIEVTRTYVTAIVAGSRLPLADEAQASRRSRDDLKARLSAKTRSEDFERGRVGFISETAVAIAENTISVSGAGGRQWKAELQALVKKAKEFTRFASGSSERTFPQLLEDWVRGRSLEPHPQGHSFCKCTGSPDDLWSAACLLEKQETEGIVPTANRAPDLAYAADLTCLICPHRVGLPCNQPYWDDAEGEATAASMHAALPDQRAAASERAARIQRHARPTPRPVIR